MKRIARNKQDLTNILTDISYIEIDKPIEIEVSEYDPNANLSQKALIHIWFKEIAKQLNKKYSMNDRFTKEFVKEDLKTRLGIVLSGNGLDGNYVVYAKSLGDYGKLELSELLTKVHVWGCDMGITLSTMNCKVYEDYKEASQ